MRHHTLLKFLIIILLIAVLFVLNLLLGTVRIPVGKFGRTSSSVPVSLRL